MATRLDMEIIEVPIGRAAAEAFPVHWSGVWVGALGTFAVGLIVALAATAIGASSSAGARLGPEDLGMGDLVASVCGAFFSFVAGGWIASRIAGLRRADVAMLHGAIVWLVAIPLLLVLLALGARAYFGPWYAGLAGTAAWATLPTGEAAAELAREAAGGAATAILIGLVGAVLGGWLGSGEPMTFGAFRPAPRTAIPPR
jgi:hypothetical protein